VEVCAVVELELVTLFAVEDEDETVVAVVVKPGAVDVVDVLEVVDERAASGTTETLELALSATNTSPFPES